jgi:membrane protein YdbS with pleckstrin-like domain
MRRRPARPLDRRVLTMWWTIAAVAAIPIVILAAYLVSRAELPRFVSIAAVAVILTAASLLPWLRYRRWRYEIRERDVFLSHGALFSVLTLVPFDRIQYVETHQGPLDLAFGLMQLAVYTAAGRAARIPGLSPEEAETLREELSRVAGTRSV